MKKIVFITCFAVIFSGGCAAVQTGSENEVTIRHGTMADYTTIQEKADRYCSQYGKKAHLRVTHRENISIFDCR